MAFSPPDPVTAHSLWLQLRSTRRRHHHPRWRSDWKAVCVPVLLIIMLALVYVMMPTPEAVDQRERAAQNETALQQPPVVGALGP
jgi:hypothetical protein